ncbi:hypothetical protein SESBI_35387 [Sesbania bispinosa]|nr:hypothetical protein SESBI_35387 [Sesbania bispinosa]
MTTLVSSGLLCSAAYCLPVVLHCDVSSFKSPFVVFFAPICAVSGHVISAPICYASDHAITVLICCVSGHVVPVHCYVSGQRWLATAVEPERRPKLHLFASSFNRKHDASCGRTCNTFRRVGRSSVRAWVRTSWGNN